MKNPFRKGAGRQKSFLEGAHAGGVREKREESYRVMEAAKYEAVPKDRREFIQKPIWQETHAGIQTSLRKPEPVREQTEVQSIAPAATPESKRTIFRGGSTAGAKG